MYTWSAIYHRSRNLGDNGIQASLPAPVCFGGIAPSGLGASVNRRRQNSHDLSVRCQFNAPDALIDLTLFELRNRFAIHNKLNVSCLFPNLRPLPRRRRGRVPLFPSVFQG